MAVGRLYGSFVFYWWCIHICIHKRHWINYSLCIASVYHYFSEPILPEISQRKSLFSVTCGFARRSKNAAQQSLQNVFLQLCLHKVIGWENLWTVISNLYNPKSQMLWCANSINERRGMKYHKWFEKKVHPSAAVVSLIFAPFKTQSILPAWKLHRWQVGMAMEISPFERIHEVIYDSSSYVVFKHCIVFPDGTELRWCPPQNNLHFLLTTVHGVNSKQMTTPNEIRSCIIWWYEVFR